MRQNTYTKESIKSRMFKRVAALWDIRNVDALDPVVKLLIEALASEIFKLSGELFSVEDRIVEKLARAFTPTHMMAASPAHAVAHARAIEGKIELFTNTELVYKDPHFVQKHNLRKLAFSPTRVVPVINGDIAVLISEGKYYEVTPLGGREHVVNCIRKSSVFTNTAWIGLIVSEEVKSLKDVSFYFDFPLLDDNENYVRLIKHSKLYHGESPIKTTPGINYISNETGVFELFDQQRYLSNEIEGKYQSQFITISENLSTSSLTRETVPKEIANLFDDTVIKELRSDLVWIKIVFPSAFDDTALSHLVVHINCFPIGNVYRKQLFVTATQISSIIPIEKEYNEYFLFMDYVTDSLNNLYKQVQNHDDNIAGTYTIRRGGSEKFNSLDARDFLERLLDLYRDESIAFSSIGREISTTAQSLMEHLTEFEKKLKSYTDNSEQTSYLILNPNIPKRTNIDMCYCLTNGEIANNIRSSEMLSIPEISGIDQQTLSLMTTTRGGRKSPPESGRKDICQYIFTTRDRVYTKDDIKMFCRCYYGRYFQDVRIEDAYEVSNEPKQGFVKVTKVILERMQEKSFIDVELLKREILTGLSQRSPEDFRYRIIIN